MGGFLTNARRVVFFWTFMHISDASDVSDVRKMSLHTEPSVSIYSEKTRDIRALDWCPGLLIFLL